MDIKVGDDRFYKFEDIDIRPSRPKTSKDVIEPFSEVFKKSMSDVNQLVNERDESYRKFVTGELEDVHEIMITAQKASFALEMTMQIRNLLINAYQELMRMR